MEYDDFTFMTQELIATSLMSTYILQSSNLLFELTNSGVFEIDNNGQEDETKLTKLMNQFFGFIDFKLGNDDSFFLIFMFSLMCSIEKNNEPSPNPFVALIKEHTFCNFMLNIMKGNELLNNLTEENLQQLSNDVVGYIRNNGQQQEAQQQEEAQQEEALKQESLKQESMPIAALPAGGSSALRGGVKINIKNIMSILSIIFQVGLIICVINYDYLTFFSPVNAQIFNKIKIIANTIKDVRTEVGEPCPLVKVPLQITLLSQLDDIIGLQLIVYLYV